MTYAELMSASIPALLMLERDGDDTERSQALNAVMARLGELNGAEWLRLDALERMAILCLVLETESSHTVPAGFLRQAA